MSSSHLFSEGDLVFAKVRGFPCWPAGVNHTVSVQYVSYSILWNAGNVSNIYLFMKWKLASKLV